MTGENSMNAIVSEIDIINRRSLEDLKVSISQSFQTIKEKEDILIDDNLSTNDYIHKIMINLGENYHKQDIHMLYFVDLQLKDLVSKMDNIDDFKNEILVLYNFCQNYNSMINKYFSKFHKQMIGEIEKFGKLNDILKNYKTYEIYQIAEQINGDKYNFYIYWSIGLMIVGLILSVFSRKIFVDYIKVFEYNSIDYWISKVGIIFIAVTGVTFCLKQAIHHQKKKDKAEQTRLELEALPTYMFNFSDEQKNEVYKELTGKYFGRDFDNEGYKDMANLIQEQIRLSHEVLKDTLLKNSNSNSKGS